MEIPTKRRGRHRRKRLLRKQLRERIKLIKREVRSAGHRTVFPEYVVDAREILTTGTMQAEAFWKNYAVAQEWQKRHSITWWRSRCVALEHENKLLRDKVRSLAQHRDTRQYSYQNNSNVTREENHAEFGLNDDDDDDEDDNLEFTVTEDMLNFFETSERHKQEMRQKRENENSEETPFVGAAESARVRKEQAELLYGDAGLRILTMETALLSTIERYEDSANPQYWPNIPLKL
ncbi:gem-associated protein 8 [Monomorium pharaonis]|uniref:gem-associated protein 8 n=1 Tax=Monomorium pharaonis TaxID=307658 RepID=UPI001747B169|nr:gem-associated protein 8 [Monomorium pharaonis]